MRIPPHRGAHPAFCTKFILPAVKRAGWDEMLQVREEFYFTKGRIIVRGKLVTRGKAKKADFVLSYKPNIPIALIEAKDNNHSVGHGIQQGLDYAATLDIPFVFSSNGDGFVFHDRTGLSAPVEANLGLDAFPSPADLWARYRAWKGLDAEAEQIVLQDYFDDGSGKAPRYYQVNAVNAAIEAIAKGRDRVLLVMATGTGKTYTAFQIIWRLWKAGRKKRILFLADRNVLIDQTMVNDFRPFGAAMAKLSTNAKTIERQDGTTVDLTLALDRKRRIDTAFEVYLGLYQAITGPEERQKLYKEFSPGFAEGNRVRLQHRLFRRAGLHLFAEAGDQRRLSRALQGHQGSHRPRRGRLSPGTRAARPRRQRDRGPDLQHQGF